MAATYPTIELDRGEWLHLRLNLTDDAGNPISDPAGDGYGIEAQGSSTRGGPEEVDLGAVFSGGQGAIDFDTKSLATKVLYFDVRVTLPGGEPVWSEKFQLKLIEPQTKPE